MRGVWFLLLLMVPVVQADLFPTGTAKRLPPLNGADGFVCSLNDQGPCFMGLTRAKSKCGPEKYIFEIRVDKNKGVGQTRIRSNSVCGGGDDTGWVDGIKKSGTFRCMSDSGRTCQCHRPWESTCEYNVNMIGDDRVQFIVDPRAGAPLNSPVMSLQQHQCALGFEKCNKNKELIKCERQSKFTFAEENKGLVIGKCGVTKNFLCNNVGGKVLEGGCCTGATSFSSPKAVTKCESKPLFTLAGLKFFTVQRCKPGKGDRACFNGKIIPNKAFAIADKVVNVGGKLLGCGLTPPLKKLNEVVATAKIEQDRLAVKKTNKPLVKEVPLCTTLDFGTVELVCKNKDGQERWVSIKQDENKKKGQQSKQAPTLGKAKAGTAGCCPFDKCWDGERCVDLGTVIEVSETKALVCAASSTQVKT